MIGKIIILIMLMILSVLDIKYKELSLKILTICFIVSLILSLFIKDNSVGFAVKGALPGIFLLFISFITGGGIGMGDGLVFIITGIYTGLYEGCKILFLAMLICSVTGGFLWIIKKKGLKERLAFVPGIGISYLIVSLLI